MKSEIILKSRYKVDNRLILVSEKPPKYKLKTKFDYKCGFDGDPSKPWFVDLLGGPFITEGTDIDGNIVKSISKDNGDIIIEFEE